MIDNEKMIENSVEYQEVYRRGYIDGQNAMLKYCEKQLRDAYLQKPIVLKISEGEEYINRNADDVRLILWCDGWNFCREAQVLRLAKNMPTIEEILEIIYNCIKGSEVWNMLNGKVDLIPLASAIHKAYEKRLKGEDNV